MKILLATDGSPCSQAAGNLLRRLSWPSASDLTVMSIVDKLELLPTTEESGQDNEHDAGQQLQQVIRHDAQRALTRESERFAAMGWTPQTLLRQGHAAHEIVSAADEMGTDVIAVGSRGISGVKRFLLGSVSHYVMTYAPCSVLIARQPQDRDSRPADEVTAQAGETDTPLRLLLATDGSPTARAAIETIATLPLQEHTHILLTTVMTLMTYYRMDILQTMSASWQAAKQAAQDGLEQAAERLRHVTPHVTVQLRESEDTSREILDVAQDFDANLIVLGHKGRSGLERLLVGSVANQVAHHAPCSVWVMRG